MSESANVQKIHQILLKPVALVLADNTAELSEAYIAALAETLLPQRETAGAALSPEECESGESVAVTATVETAEVASVAESDGEPVSATMPLRFEYVRPMSGGVHVLRLEPAIDLEQAMQLSERLSAREDVEYAEPDQPRRR